MEYVLWGLALLAFGYVFARVVGAGWFRAKREHMARVIKEFKQGEH
jgi:hypothetical protein